MTRACIANGHSYSPWQAQSIRLCRQSQLLHGPIDLAFATLGAAAIPSWGSSAYPPRYSVAASGALFVDAREFQRHYRSALDGTAKDNKVRDRGSHSRTVVAIAPSASRPLPGLEVDGGTDGYFRHGTSNPVNFLPCDLWRPAFWRHFVPFYRCPPAYHLLYTHVGETCGVGSADKPASHSSSPGPLGP